MYRVRPFSEHLNQKSSETTLKLFSKSNEDFETLSNKVTIEKNEIEGRFTRAKADMKVGENILAEDPYACILLEVYAKTHCYHCLNK